MKFLTKKYIFAGISMLFLLTACSKTHNDSVNTESSETSQIVQDATKRSDVDYQTPVPDISTAENTENNMPDQEEKSKTKLIKSLDIVQDRSEILSLELPKDKVNIDELKDYSMICITLYQKTDLSFLSDLHELKVLTITNGEEDMVPGPCNESYAESYNFLKSLNNLEYLRISKEPDFNTECLQDMDNLKYLHFYGTNIDFEGYFPNVEELEIAGGELSSKELYNFFPNLTGLGTYAVNISLKSVGKMENLEILHLSYGQSYSEISEIVNNKHLRALTLASKMDGGYTELAENEEFILELDELQYFWCLEGVISDETISRFLEINPQCEIFNRGM